ncbi:MAG: FTR1 family iron permease [Gammaproteobacteria bacterium]|nr:MAG: FTR1 family iron permease [Gammaproteobacteria bacterium]
MANALFIVWRESIEAMLVIGILHAWLRHREDAARGLRWLWSGVGAGLLVAAGLAAVMLGMQSWLASESFEYFETGMVLVASLLITQMVLWMGRRGRGLKHEIESSAARVAEQANWLGVLLLAALAVGREGAETVIFLYGSLLGQQGTALAGFGLAALAGFLLAAATFWLIQRGSRWLSWRAFFRASEILLLLLASALLVSGVERLVGLGLLPALVDPLWDSAWLLDGNSAAGGIAAALTGYRAQPALLTALAYVAYWAAVLWLRRAPATVSAQTA